MHPFKTFFIGGFECADLINKWGERVDLLRLTAHDSHALEDYQRLAAAGIHTVREGIRWSVVEKEAGVYDFTEVKARLVAAQQAGIQQLWDICHFGYPDGLMPTHPQFAARLAGVSKAFAQLYRQHTEDPLIITPINEISFLSWLAGEARGTVPFLAGAGFDQKYHLCKAAIKAIEAVREVDPAAQVMMVEPLVRVHPQAGQEPCKAIIDFNEAQFQAMDMITGRMCPELGGKPEYMNLAGFNFYYNNQWEHEGAFYGWCTVRRPLPFSVLLKEAWERYDIPVVVSETGHFGEDRAAWMRLMTDDCLEAMAQGVSLKGICIYPVLDRPDWDHSQNLIPCGIWTYNGIRERSVDEEYLTVVKDCHSQFTKAIPVMPKKIAVSV